jgi:hypothetical protein
MNAAVCSGEDILEDWLKEKRLIGNLNFNLRYWNLEKDVELEKFGTYDCRMGSPRCSVYQAERR